MHTEMHIHDVSCVEVKEIVYLSKVNTYTIRLVVKDVEGGEFSLSLFSESRDTFDNLMGEKK